jgi:hypothetical protein
MQKRVAVTPHLSLDEIERPYRTAKVPVARSHWQIIWLCAQGSSKPTRHIVEYTGYGPSWIRTIAHRDSRRRSSSGWGDHRHGNPGAAAILSRELQQHLREE